MNRSSLFAVLTLLLTAGCRHSANTHEASDKEARRQACASRPVVVAPWNVETVLVEEEEYRHLVKEIEAELSLALPDKIGELKKFKNVTVGTECTDGLRVEGRVVALVHKSRKYHYKIAARLVECSTDRLLHTVELEEIQKDVSTIASRLAESIAGELDDDDICAQLASAAPVTR